MRTLIATTLVSILAAPVSLGASGFEVHRFIVQETIPLLPAAIRPFFEKHRFFLVEHAIDPDLWRNAGFEDEPARHFVDLDAFGPEPFDALPRDYEAAVKKFGKEMVQKNGLLGDLGDGVAVDREGGRANDAIGQDEVRSAKQDHRRW